MIDNVYNAVIKCEEKNFNYIGMSAPPLRLRVATHRQSFKKEKNQTELSKKVKELKNSDENFEVVFKLIENATSYTPNTKKCNLCTAESFNILYSKHENLLNVKTEITNKCRHRSKYKIGANIR